MNQQLYFVYLIEFYIAGFSSPVASVVCLYSISVTCISSIQTKDYFIYPIYNIINNLILFEDHTFIIYIFLIQQIEFPCNSVLWNEWRLKKGYHIHFTLNITAHIGYMDIWKLIKSSHGNVCGEYAFCSYAQFPNI